MTPSIGPVLTQAPGLVPCLLQTGEYARAVASRHQPQASASEIARLVELRLRRQLRLEGPEACDLWAVVEESALRDQRVGRKAMRGQLSHLIDIAAQSNVAISILPSGTDHIVPAREPFSIFRFAGRYLGDVACIEQPDDSLLFLYKRAETEHYSHLIDTLAIRTTARSRDVQGLLRDILKET